MKPKWLCAHLDARLLRPEGAVEEIKFGDNLHETVRARESKTIVERIERALVRLKSSGKHLPQSLVGVAIDSS